MVHSPRPPTARLALLAGFALLAAPVVAHDGDPKLLDRQPHYAGRGITTGVPPVGASILPGTGITFGASGVTLLSWLALDDFSSGATAGNDCWGYVSGSGREYALMGLSSGTAFVEISDPNNPVIVAHRNGPTSTWRDIKVYGDLVYVVSEGGSGIQVFDVSNIDAGTVGNLGTVTTGGDTATHNVAIDTDSGYLYRTGGGSNGLRIYDLNANPTNPPFVGSWSSKYVHDAQVVTYTSGPASGKQIAYCCAGFNGGWDNTGLSIVDVTNKNNPVVLKEIFWSQAGYSHQVWLSEDLQYAYLNDELDENGGSITTRTWVMNVADPANASLVGNFTNGNQAIGHNLYTKGDLLYEANYRSGLRVFDTSVSATNPPETHWFDTYPDDDDDSFNGLWSNYPYFPSGVVIGSDIEKGLFVWWVGAPLITVAPQGQVPGLVSPNGDSFFVDITESSPGTLVAGSTKLHYDAGAGMQTVDLVPLGGTSYRADFPSLPCGGSVAFYVSAGSTNGLTWNWPEGGPSNAANAVVAFGETTTVSHDMESGQGWVGGIPGDNATTGIWVRVDPVGTGSQPEDDHTAAPGTDAWVTGQGAVGGGLGDNDVDGGTTTLLSPVFDLSSLSNPVVGYWRWYSNNGNGVVDDTFEVQISNGGSWVTAELLGPTGPDSVGGWIYHQLSVSDFVVPNASVQLRFRASDLGSGSIVEAGVDDFVVKDLDCSGGGPVAYCTGKLNSALCIASVSWSGTPSASSGLPFNVNATDVVAKNNGILFYGHAAAATPFQGGTLCAQAPVKRTGAQFSGGNVSCEGTYTFDFNALIQAGSDPALVVGAQVNAQFWYRDPPASFGSGLSDAVEFTIQN